MTLIMVLQFEVFYIYLNIFFNKYISGNTPNDIVKNLAKDPGIKKVFSSDIDQYQKNNDSNYSAANARWSTQSYGADVGSKESSSGSGGPSGTTEGCVKCRNVACLDSCKYK